MLMTIAFFRARGLQQPAILSSYSLETSLLLIAWEVLGRLPFPFFSSCRETAFKTGANDCVMCWEPWKLYVTYVKFRFKEAQMLHKVVGSQSWPSFLVVIPLKNLHMCLMSYSAARSFIETARPSISRRNCWKYWTSCLVFFTVLQWFSTQLDNWDQKTIITELMFFTFSFSPYS